jgi:hypothetical protein
VGSSVSIASRLAPHHVRCLLDKLENQAARLRYAENAVEHGYRSEIGQRKLLEHHVATGRYEREGRALTNFSRTLPAPESVLVQQIVHEDYNFEFLGLAEDVRPRVACSRPTCRPLRQPLPAAGAPDRSTYPDAIRPRVRHTA